MPKDIVVLGPPGTGKTTAGVTTVKRWFDSGVGTGEVAYLAFTKAAARESASRVMDEDFKKYF
jgi:superfamily I DNA/RNA helicase